MSLVLALFSTTVACHAQDFAVPDSSPMLEVYADHYEWEGRVYKTAAELEPILIAVKNKKLLTLHWFAYANDKAKLDAVEIKVRDAARVAKAAGIIRTAVISNEVF